MVQSLNTKVDLTMEATSFMGLPTYGKIMIGDRAFEYYNEKNLDDFIQIPWKEVDVVVALLMFKGRWIPRFTIRTRKSGAFTFAARHPHEALRAVRKYVGGDRIVRSLTFFQVIRRGIKAKFTRKKK
ncbi:DUF956 family protein [Ligilactobacillus hohenheimensis]|uniref:DUF956 family protein n=1 Tax=Ligilactobacillus hohenheimensis TaxID=2991832 RepID=UPI0024B9BEC3|nr:DUF956 family protein [Ligilactobacillus hohenheimensis]